MDFIFPTQLIVLRDDKGEARNLLFMAQTGETWVREDGQWVDFIPNEADENRQFEDLSLVSVDPRFIDLWDERGRGIQKDEMDSYEYFFVGDNDERTQEEPVTAAVFGQENELAAALKRVTADNIWAYHHAQGYHWNVKGSQFAEYHALFLTIYEDYLAAIDPSAENLLKINESAPYTQEDLEKYRSIPDVPSPETPKEMAAALLAINDGLRESTKLAYDEAANADQQGMVDFYGGRLDILDKWSWQLRASIA